MALSESLYKMQWTTDLSSLSNQARFGIRYFKRGMNSNETTELLKDGLKLCDILVEGAKAKLSRGILSHQVGYLKAVKPLIEESVDLEKLLADVERVLNTLNLMLENKKTNEEEVRFSDSFFVKISQIYLKTAFSTYNSLVEEKVFY